MNKRGVNSLFKGSKRGLSPLIATVLLIAFAVSMGAMIMNWSSSIGENEGAPDCSGIKLVMNPLICYSQNAIQMNIKNEGSLVEELKIKISDDNTETELNLKNSRLRKGDSLTKEIPYVKAGSTSVDVYTSVQHNGKLKGCETPALNIPTLADCTV